jgi:hypothetical protein
VPVGLTLEHESAAPTVHLSLDEAIVRRAELLAHSPPPGLQADEPAWFFRAYNDDELVFLEGRFHPYSDQRPLKRAGRYRIDRRVIVPRSDRALDLLRVRDVVEQREQGVCGIRVGMTAEEVHARLGAPSDVAYPQAAGCVQEAYGPLHVTICMDAVSNVSGERCP